MTMQYLEGELRRSLDPRDHDHADQIATILKSRGRDVALPNSDDLSVKEEYIRSELQRTAIEDYKNFPHTPELITKTWENFWYLKGRLDKPIPIPGCDRTAEELEELKANGYMMVFVPPELSTQEGRSGLQQIFDLRVFYERTNTLFRDSLLEFNSVVNLTDQSGWLDIEALSQTPHWKDVWLKGDDKLKKLQEVFDARGRIGQTLNTYIVGSEFSHFVSGQRFDSNGSIESSALLGSTWNDIPLFAFSGRDSTYYLTHNTYNVKGGRSVGIKKSS